jgi:hypothetical protein
VPTLLESTWLDCHSDGLAPILAILAAIGLLFTGKYSKGIFNLVVGINRWSYHMYAYTSLITDEYSPFRLWDD